MPDTCSLPRPASLLLLVSLSGMGLLGAMNSLTAFSLLSGLVLLSGGCGRPDGPPTELAERDGEGHVPANRSRSATSRPDDNVDAGEAAGKPELTDEAIQRKDRSLARLRQLGVPVSDDWPVSVTEATSGRRSSDEVARRAMVLCVVGLKGEGREQAVINQLIKQYGIAGTMTPDERAFVADSSPSADTRVRFAWRHESYWVLLWALGLVDELGPADSMCDVSQAASVLQSLGRNGFLQTARLRPQTELLDAADLAFRARAAVDEARRANRPAPPVLDVGVVLERERAMRWLITAQSPPWDEVASEH